MWWRNNRVYLDYASAAPVSRAALCAYREAAHVWGNPASPHAEGRAAREVLEKARVAIARLLECKSDDIIFTSGATEANNLAIRGLVTPGSHVLYLPSAHASIVESVRSLEGVLVEQIPIKDGAIDIETLGKMLRPSTVLITLEAVCGETGTLWNTREVAKLVQSARDAAHRRVGPVSERAEDGIPSANVLLHVDASQAPFTQKVTRAHFGADLLTLDAQKVGGIRGIGLLVAPHTTSLRPIMLGGGQERGLRSGTPAPGLASAFAIALSEASKGREQFSAQAAAARTHLLRQLSGIKALYVNEGRESSPHILNLSLSGRDTDYLVMLLDAAGFAVSTRSACETDLKPGEEPLGSRAVFALTRDRARALSTLRISWGPGVAESLLTRLASALVREVAFLDNTQPKSHY